MRSGYGASCAERRKLPRCELGDAARSIHSRETGARDATMDRVCAAKPTKSHCPLSSCCSRFQRFPPLVSFFFALHRRGPGTTDPACTHPSPVTSSRELEYVARKTTTVVVALRLLTT
ncbi:hypothetical protein K0M31_008734 [Melipona bicolor]|uniref:Uncharacterized protein n=1 Tax=Melipona bicolor TaxID=60889 RepID=A0AA40FQF9_9HYME|nr:hypothetical protein K0M31_008734 [Melipona bicolor]